MKFLIKFYKWWQSKRQCQFDTMWSPLVTVRKDPGTHSSPMPSSKTGLESPFAYNFHSPENSSTYPLSFPMLWNRLKIKTIPGVLTSRNRKISCRHSSQGNTACIYLVMGEIEVYKTFWNAWDLPAQRLISFKVLSCPGWEMLLCYAWGNLCDSTISGKKVGCSSSFGYNCRNTLWVLLISMPTVIGV